MAKATETSRDPRGELPALLDGLRTALTAVGVGLRWAVLIAFGVGWVAFWANLVRIHLNQGALWPTLLTLIVLVGPALAFGAAAWRG